MSDHQQAHRSRRRVLCGLGATVVASAFGTSATAATVRTRQDGTDDTDGLNGDADTAGRYADIYEEVIDDVVLVTVGGPEDEGPEGMGSGFVLEDDYVVTNNHVVGDASEVELQFRDEQWTTAEVVGTDAHSDIAVLDLKRFLTRSTDSRSSRKRRRLDRRSSLSGTRLALTPRSPRASSAVSTGRCRVQPAFRSRQRSRPTPRSTPATAAAHLSPSRVRSSASSLRVRARRLGLQFRRNWPTVSFPN